MDLLTQLNSAIKYIEDNICDDIELAKVSKVTNYSPYHFGRLFYYIAEMPISEYIRRRKLSLAAMELQTSKLRVLDLAVKYGYDSADSFTKAFIKQHGITPREARCNGVILKIFPPITFQIKIQGVQEMNWRIEEKEAVEVFGIEKIFKRDEMGNIGSFWKECHQNGKYGKLIDDAGERDSDGNEIHTGASSKISNGACTINALCGHIGTSEDETFPYMLFAVKTEKSKTSGYKNATIPKATWAIFRANECDHSECQIPGLFQRAYSEWLPSSGYDKANGPDIEIYGEDFEEVWIPIIKKN